MLLSMSMEIDTVKLGVFGVTQNIKVGAIGSGPLGGTINGGGAVTGDVVLSSPATSIKKGIATMTGGEPNSTYQFFFNDTVDLTATDPNTSTEYTISAVIEGPGSFVTDASGNGQAILSFTATVPANVPDGLHFTGNPNGIDAKFMYPQP